MSGLRILVTGSRHWRDHRVLHRALCDAIGERGGHLIVPDESTGERLLWGEITIVHGACPRGADRMAARLAHAWGMQEEPHPADWVRHGRRAGPVRNAEMVAAGADVLLAFPIGRSPGTRNCVALAEKAGIPVIVHEGVTP